MNLVFKDIGKVLGGRKAAEEIRSNIENSSQLVILDFDGVRTVSHSFADELIGKLAEKLGAVAFREKIKIINLSEANKKVFGFVISERVAKKDVA